MGGPRAAAFGCYPPDVNKYNNNNNNHDPLGARYPPQRRHHTHYLILYGAEVPLVKHHDRKASEFCGYPD
jgi:hypothetical protein